ICKCGTNFGATDCSLDIKKPPRLVDILDEGLCDKHKRDCSNIYVYGELFFGTNVTCRLQKFTIGVDEGSKRIEESIRIIPGRAETLTSASCPISNLRRRRSVSETTPADFVQGFQVTVSNDAVNFANEILNAYVYDSSCQAYDNSSSVGMIFSLRV
ncbi:uncharacterized protein LOC123561905, partial [Mercenaria mercenaria]|uniref:uncharacterized protein LOC123561905 n=1 Tax=Mercenaria mercenaria TaxID=6596 RepID=UPI00234EFDC1